MSNQQLDNITIDGTALQAYITVKHLPNKGYSVRLHFEKQTVDQVAVLKKIYDESRHLPFTSEHAKRYGYKIDYIVVKGIQVDGVNPFSVVFDCVSDIPFDLNIE